MAVGFKKSLFGFNCSDVIEYIHRTHKSFVDKEKKLNFKVDKLLEELDIAKANQEKLEAEKKRIWELGKFEREYADCGYICGIDEVGRGPLAGPVVAGAVILPKDCNILYINDNKIYAIRIKTVLIGLSIK